MRWLSCEGTYLAKGTGDGGGETETQRRAESLSENLLELCKDKHSLLFTFFLSETQLNFDELKPREQTVMLPFASVCEAGRALQWSDPFLRTVVLGEDVCVKFELYFFVQIVTLGTLARRPQIVTLLLALRRRRAQKCKPVLNTRQCW